MTSILAGEVKREDVVLIITRTSAPDYDRFIGVVNAYYEHGNPYASNVGYSLGEFERDDVLDLAYYLWHSGKIHQPRVFSEDTGYVHRELASTLWLDIAPVPGRYANESVIQAWEHYQMLSTLAK
jgi:hypothetical protein